MLEGPLFKALIDTILGAANRSMDNREKRFREYFETSFSLVASMHGEALAMLRTCEQLTPYFFQPHDKPGYWVVPSDGIAPILPADLPIKLKVVRDKWAQLREVSAGSRENLRRLAQEILLVAEDDEIEQQFLLSIINYFVHPDRNITTESVSRSVLKNGAQAVIDSSSLTIAELIENKTDPEKVREVFTTSRAHLTEAWSNVSGKYNKLYVSHIQRRR